MERRISSFHLLEFTLKIGDIYLVQPHINFKFFTIYIQLTHLYLRYIYNKKWRKIWKSGRGFFCPRCKSILLGLLDTGFLLTHLSFRLMLCQCNISLLQVFICLCKILPFLQQFLNIVQCALHFEKQSSNLTKEEKFLKISNDNLSKIWLSSFSIVQIRIVIVYISLKVLFCVGFLIIY